MATEEDVAAGLIDWVNSLELREPIKHLDEFRDGDSVWRLLQKIDQFSFSGSLPESTKETDEWVPRWNNLRYLYDLLTVFLVEECGQKLPLFHAGGRTRPDLQAIAQTSSQPDTVLLLKLCVVAAINCAERIEFLTQMQELEERTQQVLMATAQEAGESEVAPDAEDDNPQEAATAKDDDLDVYPSAAGDVDLDLASEERLGKVIADNQRIAIEKRELQKQLDEVYLRFENLQVTYDRSQDELNEANERLTAVLSGRTDGTQGKPDAKSETVIAGLEARVIQAETENEEFRKSNEVLKIKADRVQKLQDDFDEIKIERDKLSRKANTAEKYRQKLESIQDMEKDNQNLRAKVQELQTQLRQSDSSQASTSGLQREIDEYRRLLPSIEQERYDLNEMKKRLEFDYHTLEARWHELNDEHQRSQSQVEELRGRLQDYEDGVTPSTPTKMEAASPRTVEDEEEEFAEAEARLTEALLNSSNNSANNEKNAEAEDGISEQELKAIMSAMRAQAQAGSASEKELGVQAQKKLFVALDKQRTKNVALIDHIKKQSDLIQELKTRATQFQPQEVKSAESVEAKLELDAETEPAPSSQPAPAPLSTADKAALETPLSLQETKLAELFQINENLKREVKLMTSAWYEQNQRLASSSSSGFGVVSLMRSKMGRGGGVEEPRSFLGRQRKVVDTLVLGNAHGHGSKVGVVR